MEDVQNRLARELADAVAAAVAQSADVERCRERARAVGPGRGFRRAPPTPPHRRAARYRPAGARRVRHPNHTARRDVGIA